MKTFIYSQGSVRVPDDLNRAIELNPSDEAAFINRGIAKTHISPENSEVWAAERFEEAKKDFDTALRLNPRSVEALISRGTAYARMTQEFHLAKADYQNALSLDPNNELARRNMEIVEKVMEAHGLFESFHNQFKHQIKERGLSPFASELINIRLGLSQMVLSSCKVYFRKE